MNHIKQHIPAFVDGPSKQAADFETLDDLLDIPFVARWKEMPGFHRFSKSMLDDVSPQNCILLAEMENGTKWYVVGFLRESSAIHLPKWTHPNVKE